MQHFYRVSDYLINREEYAVSIIDLRTDVNCSKLVAADIGLQMSTVNHKEIFVLNDKDFDKILNLLENLTNTKTIYII